MKRLLTCRQSGFSLISTLIAVGILGAVITATMSVVNFSLKAQKNIELKDSISAIQKNIATALEETNVCSYNFGQRSQASMDNHPTNSQVNVNNLLDGGEIAISQISTKSGGTDVPLYVSGQTYERNSINIESMALTNFNPSGPGSVTTGTVNLNIYFKPQFRNLGSQSFFRSIQIKVNLDNNFPNAAPVKITDCFTAGGSADTIFTKKANGDIYYSGGNVGVGTSDPKAELQVNGTMRLHRQDNSSNFDITSAYNGDDTDDLGTFRYGVQPSSNSWGISHTGNPTNWQQFVTVTTNGNTGVGVSNPSTKLQVAGGVRPGNQVEAVQCDASTEGAIRYVAGNAAAATKIEYCQRDTGGSFNWQGTGGGGLSSCTIRTNSVTNGSSCGAVVSCLAGEIATGGGCNSGSNARLSLTRPVGSPPSAWQCACWQAGAPPFTATVYAICCQL